MRRFIKSDILHDASDEELVKIKVIMGTSCATNLTATCSQMIGQFF